MNMIQRLPLRQILAILIGLLFLSGAPFASAAESGRAPASSKQRVLFMGSSSVDYWDSLEQDFPEFETINVGKAGTTYTYLIDNAEAFLAQNPADIIVVYSGDNDVSWGTSAENVGKNFGRLVQVVRKIKPSTPIVVLSIKPSAIITRRLKIDEIRAANEMIKKEAAKHRLVKYVDIFSQMLNERGSPRGELFKWDRIHMNARGYEIWSRSLSPVLKSASFDSQVPLPRARPVTAPVQ